MNSHDTEQEKPRHTFQIAFSYCAEKLYSVLVQKIFLFQIIELITST